MRNGQSPLGNVETERISPIVATSHRCRFLSGTSGPADAVPTGNSRSEALVSLHRRLAGGGGGIRTHEGLSSLPVFKTGAFNRSATPPGLLGFIASALTARLFASRLQPFERARLKVQLAHRLRVRRTAQSRRVVNLVGAK